MRHFTTQMGSLNLKRRTNYSMKYLGSFLTSDHHMQASVIHNKKVHIGQSQLPKITDTLPSCSLFFIFDKYNLFFCTLSPFFIIIVSWDQNNFCWLQTYIMRITVLAKFVVFLWLLKRLSSRISSGYFHIKELPSGVWQFSRQTTL